MEARATEGPAGAQVVEPRAAEGPAGAQVAEAPAARGPGAQVAEARAARAPAGATADGQAGPDRIRAPTTGRSGVECIGATALASMVAAVSKIGGETGGELGDRGFRIAREGSNIARPLSEAVASLAKRAKRGPRTYLSLVRSHLRHVSQFW